VGEPEDERERRDAPQSAVFGPIGRRVVVTADER
jgi:hypothetical protein